MEGNVFRMKKKAKSAVVLSICLLGIAFAALNVLAYNHAYAMMHFTSQGARTREPERLAGLTKLKVLLSGVNVPRPTSAFPPSTVDPMCHALFIGDPDGIRLACRYCDRGRETPLVMHGSDDPRATLAEGRRVFDAVSSDKTFQTFQNTGHHSYIEAHRAAWTDAVENLMKKTENRQIHGTTCRRP
jgi:hypothetical protein